MKNPLGIHALVWAGGWSDCYDLARHAKAFMEAQLESLAQVEQS